MDFREWDFPGSADDTRTSLRKFRPFNKYSLQNLKDSTLYFAPKSAFNDILDSLVLYDIVDDHCKWHFIKKHIHGRCQEVDQYLTRRAFNPDKREDGQGNARIVTLFRRFNKFLKNCPVREIADYIEKTVEQLGICSLMHERSGNSELFWAHYGDNHRGVAMTFTVPSERPNGDFYLKKVKYSKKPYCIDLGKFIDATTSAFPPLNEELERTLLQEIIEGVSRKGEAWSHEREYRLIAPGKAGYSLPNPFKISQVAVGLRMGTSRRNAIRKLFPDQYMEPNGTLNDLRRFGDIRYCQPSRTIWPR